jgi:predicted transcriptional regulator
MQSFIHFLQKGIKSKLIFTDFVYRKCKNKTERKQLKQKEHETQKPKQRKVLCKSKGQEATHSDATSPSLRVCKESECLTVAVQPL